MIDVHCTSPLKRLHSSGTDTLVIRANPKGGWTGYLDFSEVHVLSFENTCGQIEKLSSSSPKSNGLSFSGWVGFFGYEFLARHFGANLSADRDLSIPDGWFGRPSTVMHIQQDRISIESTLPERESEIAKLIENSSLPGPHSFVAHNRRCNLSFEEYEKIFLQAREAILDGETYQIKISQRFEAEAKIDPLLAFAKLSASNPAPEAFLLKTPEFSLVSCSPEVVIEKTGNRILTRPIGGTYARNSSGSDQSVIERFLNDAKEVSEHNMLVDLERNDLSSLCVPGTVHLERFREVETYSHLHHLVSTIHGELKPSINLSDILQGMLPGGSITGCPKIRTMEWIDKLEPCFRGPYTGSFGIIEDSGDLHLNLIIRSMLILGERCYTQAGGGIVVDSTPEYEYRENQIKAQALLDLLS
jgi:para-aminobenzoate synthetase component 1